MPVVLYVAFIFWLSSAPRPIPALRRFPWLDKPLHAVEYAPLGSLLVRAFIRSWAGLSGGIVQVLASLGALTVGTLDELYQRFTPLRVSSGWDTLADLLGAAIGQWLYWTFTGRRRS